MHKRKTNSIAEEAEKCEANDNGHREKKHQPKYWIPKSSKMNYLTGIITIEDIHTRKTREPTNVCKIVRKRDRIMRALSKNISNIKQYLYPFPWVSVCIERKQKHCAICDYWMLYLRMNINKIAYVVVRLSWWWDMYTCGKQKYKQKQQAGTKQRRTSKHWILFYTLVFDCEFGLFRFNAFFLHTNTACYCWIYMDTGTVVVYAVAIPMCVSREHIRYTLVWRALL